MATSAEINSFVSKFKFLLASGFKASLTISAENGEAIVNLNANLGSLDFIPENRNQYFHTPGQHGRPRNQAYLRRQENRKVTRHDISLAEEARVVHHNKTIPTVNEYVAEQVTNISDKSTAEEVVGTEMEPMIQIEPVISTLEVGSSEIAVQDFSTNIYLMSRNVYN